MFYGPARWVIEAVSDGECIDAGADNSRTSVFHIATATLYYPAAERGPLHVTAWLTHSPGLARRRAGARYGNNCTPTGARFRAPPSLVRPPCHYGGLALIEEPRVVAARLHCETRSACQRRSANAPRDRKSNPSCLSCFNSSHEHREQMGLAPAKLLPIR